MFKFIINVKTHVATIANLKYSPDCLIEFMELNSPSAWLDVQAMYDG